jgi:ABC-type multidrug transport system ATPase subunit
MAGMKDSAAFVDVRRLSVRYEAHTGMLKRLAGKNGAPISALEDISFKLSVGSWVTVFGPPASGKTTLLKTLAGEVAPSSGEVRVNGKDPATADEELRGYICPSSTSSPTVRGFSTTQRLQAHIESALEKDVPLLLLDDVADELGVEYVKQLLSTVFVGRTGIISTRFAATAQALELPILLLHQSRLAHQGTAEDIAAAASLPRIVDVWLEGVRYDLLRQLRRHPGVTEVRLVPSDQYSGQRLRVWLRSSHYLPSLYDVVSQGTLIKIEELPPSLADLIARLA